jgi:hypothetical protein
MRWALAAGLLALCWEAVETTARAVALLTRPEPTP